MRDCVSVHSTGLTQAEALHDHALASEGSVTVHLDTHDFVAEGAFWVGIFEK